MANKKQYAIITMQKISSKDSYNSRSSHNDRSIPCPDADSKLTINNICLKNSDYKNYDDFVEKKKSEIKKYNLENNKKNRFLREKWDSKNKEYSIGGIGCEFVITHSHEAMSEEESIEYLKNSFEFIKSHFKNCEIDDAWIHLDEKTPHLHIKLFFFHTQEKRFWQKELSQDNADGNRVTNINHIRYEFQKYLKKVGGIGASMSKQDGKVVKKGKHTQAKKEVGDLKDKIKKISEDLKYAELGKKSNFEDNKKLINERYDLKNKVQQLEIANKELLDRLEALEKKYNTKSKAEEETAILEEVSQDDVYGKMLKGAENIKNTNKLKEAENSKTTSSNKKR